MDLTEEQIKQGLRNKIKGLEKQIEHCKVALKAFGEDFNKPRDLQINVFDEINIQDTVTIRKDRKTVRARVEGLLADIQTPMTSREIMDTMNRVFKKNYKFNNFSGNFSQTYRKANSKIQRFEIADQPAEYKFVYGLKSWAVDEELKQEYSQRFIDKHS